MMINPGLHPGTINHVTRRIVWPTDLDLPLKFATFNPMSLVGLEISEEGDSGGPVINREGELVGLFVASGKAINPAQRKNIKLHTELSLS